MTRVFKRAMFRLGGNTDQGIMSGVVPRQGYQGTNNPADQRVMSEFEKRFLERKALEEKYAPRGSYLGYTPAQGLIDFGLNLASAEPRGSIFATAAESAKGPFGKYAAGKAERAAEDRRFTQALIGDISEQLSKEEQERIAAGAKGEKQYASLAEDQLLADLLNKKSKLKREIEQLQKSQDTGGIHPPRPIDEDLIQRKQEELDNLNVRITDRTGGDTAWDKIPDYIKESIYDEVEAEMPNASTQEILQEVINRISKLKFSTGGRVGYANAGPVTGQAMPEQTQPVMNPTATGNDLTFQELRARLPETVSDDIVQLLVNSEEALVEFANIQTERDIATFNRKYQVNLVLPQEA